MLNIKIAGSKYFCDQIKNKLEWMEDEGFFAYTEDSGEAAIIISEEESCFFHPNVYIYIEVLRSADSDQLCAVQYIMGKKVEAFPLENLPYVLQGTIRMMALVIKKEHKISEMASKSFALEEDQKNTSGNLENFKRVQNSVTQEMKNIPGFETKLLYLPKNDVSGDFFVTKHMPDGKTFVFIGDVTGHGFYAGTYAATMVALARSYFDTCSMMGANLQNFALYIAKAAFYYHGGNEQSSCECVACEIDPKSNIANFITFSGGNISPIIIKKSGKVKTVYSLKEDGTPEAEKQNEEVMRKIKPRLGEPYYEDNITFDSMPGVFTERFCVGDTILFYTDGFSEMFSHTEDGGKDQMYVYGVENMERAVQDAVSTKGNDPDVVVNAVVSDISSYGVKGLYESKSIENLIYDDATMFCLKRVE